MTSLRQSQRAFAANLLADRSHDPGGLFDGNNIPVERLLNVYRNNSRASFRAALAAVYPVIQKLVGSEFFQYMADRYVRDFPLPSGEWSSFGRDLPNFLSKFDPVSTLPYLVDVAHLEWAHQVVSTAAPLQPSCSTFLWDDTSADLSKLRFTLAPACSLVSSCYPIFSIWKVNQDGCLDDKTVGLDEGSQTVLVLRSTDEVELWRLRNSEAAFVRAMANGTTLGATVELMMSQGYTFGLETLLVNYVQSGCLVAANVDQR